ncbi:hypothetical protein [Sneathiella sp. HT1-7]|jgi:hypothetical protein|uniref:hypothetical protein n=1 Tax=Sneathiella sp. HT1-7 TaxID=2887192 RepID=UPI001D1357D4|nr:hypothetical protein [Sneathiella sp. HT1-7]MCC3304096.1 hypothetical protein [Sneathiella sp. HT1-7]
MTEFGINLWGATFQAISFLCLMAIPWTDGKIRLIVALVAAAGLLSILAFQFYIGVVKRDYGLGMDLMLVTILNALLYFAISWGLERVFRLYLLKRKKDRQPPVS